MKFYLKFLRMSRPVCGFWLNDLNIFCFLETDVSLLFISFGPDPEAHPVRTVSPFWFYLFYFLQGLSICTKIRQNQYNDSDMFVLRIHLLVRMFANIAYNIFVLNDIKKYLKRDENTNLLIKLHFVTRVRVRDVN